MTEAITVPSFATTSHTYRIEWSATDVKYFVDDLTTPVATHPVAIASPMRPIVSDFDAPDAEVVTVGSLGRIPNAGTFASRVFNASDARVVWGALTSSVDTVPSGTAAAFQTRTGNTPTVDSTWSAYQPLGANGAIQSPSAQYIQYRADLSTTVPGHTPSLARVQIDYDVDSTAPTTTIDGVQVSDTTATATFSGADAHFGRFECSLDGGAPATCTSPKVFSGLAVGSHTLSVKGIDTVGNSTSDVKTFTVDSPAVTGGGGTTGTTGTTQQPGGGTSSVDRTAPKVSVVAKSLRASKKGTVSFRVGCPATETSCKVQLQLKSAGKVAAKKTVTVKGGKTKTVTLTLNSAAKKLLAKRHSLKLSSVVSATDAAGNRKTTTKQLTLRRAAG